MALMARTGVPTISCDLASPSSPESVFFPSPSSSPFSLRRRLLSNFGTGNFFRRLTSLDTTTPSSPTQKQIVQEGYLSSPLEPASSHLYRSKSYHERNLTSQPDPSSLSALSVKGPFSRHRYSLSHLRRMSFRWKQAGQEHD